MVKSPDNRRPFPNSSLPAHFETVSIMQFDNAGGMQVLPVRTLFSQTASGQPFPHLRSADFRALSETDRFQALLDHACAKLLRSSSFAVSCQTHSEFAGVSLTYGPLAKKVMGEHSGVGSGQITLSERLARRKSPLPVSVWILAHEFRHNSQKGHDTIRCNTLPIEQQLFLTRFKEADACVFQTTVAWELRVSGDASLWNSLIRTNSYGPVAAVFAARVLENPENAVNGVAQSAVFDAWIASPTLTGHYDEKTCADYLKCVDKTHCSPTPVTDGKDQLRRLLEGIRPMPFRTETGALGQRPGYLNDAMIERLLNPSERTITPAAFRLVMETKRALQKKLAEIAAYNAHFDRFFPNL